MVVTELMATKPKARASGFFIVSTILSGHQA